ncbi:MAG: flagellar assembly protein FliW [Syntrophaceae bacterium]|nr:flagellar assembly protein FliW [Syntrophaceae bacterium]
MKIETDRFGTVEIQESEVIEFKSPILGFEQLRRFVLLRREEEEKAAEKDAPFYWLQSVEDKALAFLVIPTVAVKSDYRPLIPEKDMDSLGIKNEEDVVLLSVATVHPDPLQITANLRAPLVINVNRRLATQTILEDADDADYPVRYELQAEKPGEASAPAAQETGRKIKIETKRFGTVEIGESQVIEFKSPVLGFEQLRRFALLRHAEEEGTPFYWLQSLEDGALAFLVIPAVAVKADYRPLIPEKDIASLEIKNEEDVVLLSIATVRPDPLQITANLRAPLVINVNRRLACQTILEDANDADCPVRYELRGER